MIKRLGYFKWICSRLSAYAIAFLAASVQANGFSYQSEHEKLADHTIISAGTLTIATDLQNLEDQGTWGQIVPAGKLYRLGGYCFHFGFLPVYSPALIVVDRYSQSKVAVFETSGSELIVKVHSIQLLDCRAISKDRTQQMLDRSKNIVEDMERQQQRNAQMLKELQDAARQRKGQN